MYGHSKWSPHNFRLDFGSIQINFLTNCLQKHFYSSPFLYAIFEKYDFDFSWQIQVYSTFWYVIKHSYGVQKYAEQNFDTYEYPIWAINHNLRTFLKSSKPFVLFISDTSLGI